MISLKITNAGMGGWINPRPEQLAQFYLTKQYEQHNK